jgi:tetratricopeptide (TPR) repeat protein
MNETKLPETISASIVVSRRVPTPAQTYIPAIGPTLRLLLYGVFVGFALLGATGAYLLMISILNRLFPDHLFTTPFTFLMLVFHVGLGVLGAIPVVVFGLWHWWTARCRQNRAAIRWGLLLFACGLVVIGTGVALIQVEQLPQLPTGTWARWIVYVLHIAVPILCVCVYVFHRKAGPRIQWEYGKYWLGVTAVVLGGMAGAHFVDPQQLGKEGPEEGMAYFFPSEARTADGNFIPVHALMMDEYCARCHQDVYNDHFHSAHKFSSFNNPAYLFSVRETREVALKRDGRLNASRWCAGCHDPVPFFSGKFDDPNYDIINDPTAHAGITCVVCHSITHIHATIGNAAYTIEQAQHYPFAFSDNSILQWINGQLIKAKPELHKKTFLKPFHRTAEFCSTCHKVHLPVELNHYKDFLRGQNHYDTYLLSAVGHGARSFYYPATGRQENCASCHMPLEPSRDFGAKDFDGSGVRKRHSHFFPAANTGLFELLKHEPRYADQAQRWQAAIDKHTAFLKDNKLRIDIFGLKHLTAAGGMDDDSLAVIRPHLPKLKPGGHYVVEIVIRTVNIGHPFTQGTADSNEVWVDFEARSGDRVIGRNGALSGPDDTGEVDPWSHFSNVHMLDRLGNRIDRRNPQDMFTPLYDKQIPPGAGQVVHYRLEVPQDVTAPVEIRVRLRYRKFDYKYMEYVHRDLQRPIPKLPIVDLCADRVVLPVEGVAEQVPAQESPIRPAWQRWNDYGIGCLLEGTPLNPKRGNLRQAEVAFRRLTQWPEAEAHWHGYINLARVYIEQGRLEDAAVALQAAHRCQPPAPWWLMAWLQGVITAQQATSKQDLETAAQLLASIVDPAHRVRDEQGRILFDFTRDVVVLDELGRTWFKRSTLELPGSPAERQYLLLAVQAYERTLAIDMEDIDAHYGLYQCYDRLAVGAPTPPVAEHADSAMLESLTAVAVRSSASIPERQEALTQLHGALIAWSQQPPDPRRPRLPALRSIWRQLQQAYHAEPDAPLQSRIAAVLSEVHRIAHSFYKPDELARAYTTRQYRAKNPAANAAAEAIVIYPTTHSLPK